MSKSEVEVLFDSEAFKGVIITTHQEDGSYSKEYGLTWKLSPEATIKELQRLYAIEDQVKKQNDYLQQGQLIKS